MSSVSRDKVGEIELSVFSEKKKNGLKNESKAPASNASSFGYSGDYVRNGETGN